MKFNIFIKDPDGIGDSISSAIESSLASVKNSLNKEEYKALQEKRRETIQSFLERLVKYREIIVLEADTDLNTVTVLKE